MDELSTVFITLGINIGYNLLHYIVRKISDFSEIDLLCFKFRKNESSIKNKRSSESDKDAVTEITIK